MNVVVTGAAGFIGGRLARALLSDSALNGHDVTRLVLVDRMLAPLADTRVALVEGDLGDPAVRAEAVAGADVVFHLAAVPGGMAERDPDLSRRVNVEATLALAEAAAVAKARFVYASTIAVFGSDAEIVDDETAPRPAMIYGQHKRAVELALADHARQDRRATVSVRLPGVIARPPGGSGLKSAFMSDVLYALHGRRPFTCPVSASATVWLMSVRCCVDNLINASRPEVIDRLGGEAVTLPALRATLGALVDRAASAFDADPSLVRFEPDAALEAVFGRLPRLVTTRAEAVGFRHDGDLAALMASVASDLAFERA